MPEKIVNSQLMEELALETKPNGMDSCFSMENKPDCQKDWE